MSKASAYFVVEDVDSEHDVAKLKKELDTLKGVFSVSVNLEKSQVCVDYDISGVNMENIETKIKNLGYNVILGNIENHIM